MTLQNGALHGGKCYLWSDTAWTCQETGEIAGHSPKAFLGLEWPWVVSTSLLGASSETVLAIAREVGKARPRCTDELVALCQVALKRYVDGASNRLGRFMIGVWDRHTRTARLFMIASDETGLAEPFEPAELVHLVSSGNALPEYAAFVRGGLKPADMLPLIDRQQAERVEGIGFAAGQYIGGECQQFRVGPAGVKAKTVRNWMVF